MIDFGIITAPREPETLNFTIKSFREKLYAPFKIYAEPGEYHIKHSDVEIYVSKEKNGAFKNFHRAVIGLLSCSGQMLCVLSDDLIFNSTLKTRLLEIEDKATKEAFGYYALFTNGTGNNVKEKFPVEGWHINPDGWNSWHSVFVIRKDIAKKMIEHKMYKEHFNHPSGAQIDGIVCKVMQEIGLKGYVHNPSPCATIGISTLGHTGIYDGYNFKL